VYLIRQRVERAKSMMLSSDAGFAEIAIACGFADQSHMTRLFTRLVRETPKIWRRDRTWS
jgi:AraC family transcriptional regulator